MIGKEDVDESFKVLTLDMNKRSKFGSTFLTLYTDVQTDFTQLQQFSSSTHRLDLGRPDSRGGARCKVFRGTSSAKFYTGFLPVLTGYNGENGLLRRITVYQCSPGSSDLVTEFTTDTQDCGTGSYPPHTVCKAVLFSWAPGSGGEILGEGVGLEAHHYLLLESSYNAGTGFLADSSGVQLFYTGEPL